MNILSKLASLLRRLADFLDSKSVVFPNRLAELLSKPDLSLEERNELADLVNRHEGNVIFFSPAKTKEAV